MTKLLINLLIFSFGFAIVAARRHERITFRLAGRIALISLFFFCVVAIFGLLIGNFEMDMSDGEVRFKTSIDVEGDRLSTALLRRLVDLNLEMMDKYLPGLHAVIEEGTPPVSAIAAIEGPTKPRFEG